MRLAAIALLATTHLVATPAGASGQTIARWERLIESNQQLPPEQKLAAVNRFINSALAYAEDTHTWGTKDYWATPLESLAAGAGDCEDYAAAKYFSLLRLGIAQERMRLVYVKEQAQGKAHVVLAFYGDGRPAPLILDNITEAIVSVEDRVDLQPVYSMGMDGVRMSLGRTEERYFSERMPINWVSVIARASRDGSLGEPDAALEGKAAPAKPTTN